ncbi:hypothetical protein C8J56DRAFT_1160469 [Mycena floridula]|nr:hypothetical protein C8J56DRAFT_1160469 [Mycena floridula]
MSTAAQIDLTGNNFGTVGRDVASNNVGQNYGTIVNHAPTVTKQLKDLARHDTAYNSHEREREEASVCAPETRREVLKQLDQWARGHGEPVHWLSGPAGAGKSTIAHTVAQQCDENHCLAFSYFFSRRYTNRSNLSAFIPTFVYTLAKSTGITSIEHKVNEALETNTGLFHQRLEDQLRMIAGIIIPVLSAKPPALPIVVVIDGLDEYNQAEGKVHLEHLVQILIDTMVKQLHFRILFISRPEADIAEMFELVTSMSHMALQDFPAIKDVENYLLPEFHKVAERRKLGADWPGPGVVTSLAEKSEGIFAYASTLVRFIDDKYGDPQRNLESAKRMHKGLDSLYKQVLEDAKSYPNFGLVIGAITLLHKSFEICDLPSLLCLDSVGDVHLALRGCLSVMILPESSTDFIRPHHTSLQDFLKDSNRHQHQFFKSATVHQHILFGCIDIIIHYLQSEVKLEWNSVRIYAFRSWIHHFNGILTTYDQESIESSELEAQVIQLLGILIPNIHMWMPLWQPYDRGKKLQQDLELAITQSNHVLPNVISHWNHFLICFKEYHENLWHKTLRGEAIPRQEAILRQEDTNTSVHMHQISLWKTLIYWLRRRLLCN